MINFPLPGGQWRLVQKFGERPDVYARFGLAGHNGLDLAPQTPGQTGIPVYAPHEGYLTIPPFDAEGYGNYVQILSLKYQTTGEQRFSVLAHFEDILVPGGYVHQGDKIGIMGMTGFADGIHTHWTYKNYMNGAALNQKNGFKGALDILQFCCTWQLPDPSLLRA